MSVTEALLTLSIIRGRLNHMDAEELGKITEALLAVSIACGAALRLRVKAETTSTLRLVPKPRD